LFVCFFFIKLIKLLCYILQIPIIKEVEKAINEIELRRKNAERQDYKEAKTPPISTMPSSERIYLNNI